VGGAICRGTAHQCQRTQRVLAADRNLESGSSLGRYVATSELPPWEEICSELKWRHHGIGRFSRSHFGFPGIYRLVGLSSDGRIWDPAPIKPSLSGGRPAEMGEAHQRRQDQAVVGSRRLLRRITASRNLCCKVGPRPEARSHVNPRTAPPRAKTPEDLAASDLEESWCPRW
jgi:hypothetical protein